MLFTLMQVIWVQAVIRYVPEAQMERRRALIIALG